MVGLCGGAALVGGLVFGGEGFVVRVEVSGEKP